MPAVKPGSAGKWVRRASSASGEYKDGIEKSTVSWEASTLAAEANHKAGTEAALRDGRFAKGVRKSGNAYWKQRATTLGPSRFAEGVTAGEQNYTEGVAPYLAVIEQTTLPARGPKGDPRNYERVKAMGTALRAKKLAGGS